ncbi:MAG: hypothetical protein II567_14315 [Candidatus Riflebacteria bacterium]|nr:hypothetical protein [Candidatus Riflebacteria bacterium]
MSSEKTVINMSLLLWCFAVIIELCILAYLVSGLVLLGGVILISPILAAFSWPAMDEIEHDGTKTSEAKTEKAEQ